MTHKSEKFNIKPANFHIIGIPKEEREKGAENLFEEIIAKNIPNLTKEKDIQVQEYRESQTR